MQMHFLLRLHTFDITDTDRAPWPAPGQCAPALWCCVRGECSQWLALQLLVTSVNTEQKNPELCAAFIAPRQHFNGINLDSLSPRDEGGEKEWAWNYPAVARRRHTGLWLVILLLSRKLLLKHSLLELFWLWWVVRWYDPDKCILILSHFI